MIFYIIGGILLLVLAVVLYRTLTFQSDAAPSAQSPMTIDRDMTDAVEKLSAAIKYQTTAQIDYKDIDVKTYEDFQNFLVEAFPLVHKNFTLLKINEHALIYQLQGTDNALNPILFLAHYDVVPVDQATLDLWEYPAFSGQIANGSVYGRGTLDDKNQLMALMQTAENLLADNFKPKRSIYFAFGQDEETGGRNGALKVAEYFSEKKLHFDAVYDEGGVVITDGIKGVKHPIALIGVAEKGYNNFKVTVSAKGGHSSMPPKHSALGDIAQIAVNIEKSSMKPMLTPPALNLLKNICSEMGFAVKMAVCNLWLFKPLLLKILSMSPTTNAMIRTTFAVTMAKGSDAPNVLPQSAELVVNARILQGNTPQDAMDFIKAACKDIPAQVEPLLLENPSPTSKLNSFGYQKLIETIKEVYPNAIPSPYLVMGGTDARKYYCVSDCVYRFMPALITSADQATMHAANEHISLDNYKRMIKFFEKLITNYDE